MQKGFFVAVRSLVVALLFVALPLSCQSQPKRFKFPDMPPLTRDVIIDWEDGSVHGCVNDTMPPDIHIPMGCYLIREVDGVPVTEASQKQLRKAVRKAIQGIIDGYNRKIAKYGRGEPAPQE